jgi:LmbE family N-acetylglucosaminyl deacetylase
MRNKVVLAIGAHPDDIEFFMAGTLLLLGKAGYQTHYLTIANGSCGSAEYSAPTARSIRNTEARAGAKILEAQFHSSLCEDMEILYKPELLRGVSAVIREVKPGIILTHSPQDYMEDHMIASRLAVTAAFTRGMPNFRTVPARATADYDVTIYHALPHGLRDQLRMKVIPGAFVNTTSVQKTKRDALAAHKSQRGWLEVSQGVHSFTLAMENMALEVGTMSLRFKYAEGWRRHLHLGYSATDGDPLHEALGKNYLVNAAYEKLLGNGA